MAQIIDKVQFENEHDRYKQIQSEGIAELKKTTLSKETEQFYIHSEELSFVFERELVLYLLAHPDAKYLRVYYGAIPSGDNPLKKKAGTPTIILSAAQKNSPYSDVGKIYVEWPTGLNAKGIEIT